MRVTVLSRKTSIHILVDLRSTHNLLDIAVAKKLGCRVKAIQPQAITMVDGNRLQCLYVCKGFHWDIHSEVLILDVMIIPSGSCDIVLGFQWLSQVGIVK